MKMIMNKTFSLLLVSLLCSYIFYCCKDTVVNQNQEIEFPEKNISYTQHVGPLLQQKCAIGGCHTQNGYKPNLEYPASYTSLLDYIVIGNPEHSTLIQLLEGTLPPKMPPPNTTSLTENQIKGIKTWIREGAKAN